MSTQLAQNDALAAALAEIHARFGESGFSDRRRVISLLADMVPEAKREIRAVGTAIDEGVPAALAGSERHLIGLEMDRLTDRLESSTGLRRDIARPVVRAFAFAMGLGPLPSIYIEEPAVGVPPAPAAPGGWAGMSEPVSPAPVMHAASGYHSAPMPPAGEDTITIGGRVFPRKQAIAWGVGLSLLFVGWQAYEFVGERQGTVVNASTAGFAQENNDFGVAGQATLQANVSGPTPLRIPAGKRISTAELQTLLAQDGTTILIDTLDGQHQTTIQGARFIPFGGAPGSFDDRLQPLVVRALTAVAGDKPARPLVFFCAGASCWESYNAVLRADAAKFRNLYWYRGGLAAWQAANLPMEQTPAPYAAPTERTGNGRQ